MSKRYFIHLAYDGSSFNGWQRQNNAPSVQQCIEDQLEKILRVPTPIVGCGRTDAGVHASSYYAHFEAVDLPDLDWVHKLNRMLPAGVAVYDLFEVEPDLHARFSAIERGYKYLITRRKNPFRAGTHLMVSKPLDVELMNRAASYLTTIDDFASFCKVGSDQKTTLCDVRQAKFEQRGDELVFSVRADRFLRNMIRAMVGTLLEVGFGNISIEEFKQVMQTKDRSAAGKSVAGHALFLDHVVYPFNKEEH